MRLQALLRLGLYRGEFAVLARDLWLNTILAWPVVPRRVRLWCLRLTGLSVGKGAMISPRCFFGGTRVAIGARSFLNYGCFIDTAAPVRIGADCSLGMSAMLCTGSHEIGGPAQRAGRERAAPVTIEDGCWIGARAVVLPGVTVGQGCVIGAGTVVVADCEPHGVYAGNPARRVRELATECHEERAFVT